MSGRKKVISLRKLKRLLPSIRGEGRKIVFTNGCFDIIHAGHVRYLSKARGFGDILVVGLNSDLSIKKIKGEKRPIVPQRERAEVLSAIDVVDYIVIFDEPTPIKLIECIEPDFLVKGADWSGDSIVGGDVVKRRGGKVVRIRFVRGISTTGIVERILEIYKKEQAS